MPSSSMPGSSLPRCCVIGAGAFGGWTALFLRRAGCDVTLIDAWGAGNSRASSGGETRVIRATYGPKAIYTQMTVRALELWRTAERDLREPCFVPTGVLWLAGENDSYEQAALPVLRQAGVRFAELDAKALQRRFPQINPAGVRWAILEETAGYLHARQSCQLVQERFLAEGGGYIQGSVNGERIQEKQGAIFLTDGSVVSADVFIFACGPWLPELFTKLLAHKLRPTRQEVFFFGTPSGNSAFNEQQLPVWIDNTSSLMYGIPGNRNRGFKIGDDRRGPVFDPTNGDRTPSAEGIQAARDYLGFRFPAMKDAPLLESRVCQYENTPDYDFILDRHPAKGDVWIVGGGSGHGFKHGPAVGEMTANAVLGKTQPPAEFRLSRLATLGFEQQPTTHRSSSG